MKKSKLILSSLAAIGASGLITPMVLTSCANSKRDYSKYAEAFKESIITEFKELSKTPRISYDLGAFRTWVQGYIKDELGCEAHIDNINTTNKDMGGNIWFDIPASKGCEEWKKIILQGHYDMVWDWDSTKGTEPTPKDRKIEVEDDGGDILHSKNYQSSLGADNGIALAFMFAIARDKTFKHGPIRCLLTSDEEEGMRGASVLGWKDNEGKKEKWNVLDANYLLNIDSEVEDEITVSNAGGLNWEFKVDSLNEYLLQTLPEDTSTYKLTIKGCLGGHSAYVGDGRANAAQELIYALIPLFAPSGNIYLHSLSTPGVDVGNKIPEEAQAVFAYANLSDDEISKYQDDVNSVLKETCKTDPDIECTFEKVTDITNFKYINSSISQALIKLVAKFKYGAISWLEDEHIHLKTSANIAPLVLDLDKNDGPQFSTINWQRSADNEILDHMKNESKNNVDNANNAFVGEQKVTINEKSTYPAWPQEKDNKMENMLIKAYANIGHQSTSTITHSGIECSWWAKIHPGIIQASIGPNVTNAHSSKETVSKSSIKNVVQVVLYILDEMGRI